MGENELIQGQDALIAGKFQEGKNLLKMAVNKGNVKALHILAILHLTEGDPFINGVELSAKEGKRLLELGATTPYNDPDCMIALGLYNAGGLPCPQGLFDSGKKHGWSLINKGVTLAGEQIDYRNCYWIAMNYMRDADAKSNKENVAIAIKMLDKILSDEKYSNDLAQSFGEEALDMCKALHKLAKSL